MTRIEFTEQLSLLDDILASGTGQPIDPARYLDFLIAKGRAKRALELVDEALEKTADDLVLRCHKARIYLSRERFDTALKLYTEVLKLDDAVADAWAGKGLSELGLGRLLSAKGSLERALALNPDHFAATHGLARLYLEIGDVQEAHDLMQQALTREGLAIGSQTADLVEDLSVVVILRDDSDKAAEIQEAWGAKNRSEIALARIRLRAYLRAGRPQHVIEAFDRLKSRLQRAPEIGRLAADAWFELGEYSRAYRAYEPFRSLDVASAMRMAEILFRSKQFDEASELMNELGTSIAEMGASVAEYRYFSCRSFVGLRNLATSGVYEQILHLTEDIDTTQPHQAELYYFRASTLKELGRLDEASLALDLSLGENPWHPDSLFLQGEILNESGSPQEAIEPLERALKLQPDNPAIYRQLAEVYSSLEEYEPALEPLDRAMTLLRRDGVDLSRIVEIAGADAFDSMIHGALLLERHQAAVNLLYKKSICLEHLGRFAQGVAAIDEALEIFGKNEQLTLKKAMLLLSDGASIKALELVLGLCAEQPESADALFHLAWIYYKIGLIKNARTACDLCLAQDAGHQDALNLREHLGSKAYADIDWLCHVQASGPGSLEDQRKRGMAIKDEALRFDKAFRKIVTRSTRKRF